MSLDGPDDAVNALRNGHAIVEKGNARDGYIYHIPKDGEVLTFGPARSWNEEQQRFAIYHSCTTVKRLADWAWDIIGSFDHDEISLHVVSVEKARQRAGLEAQ